MFPGFQFSYNLVEMVKDVDPTADIGVVLHGGDVVTEQFIEKMKNLKTGLNTVFFSHYARKITPVVLERCKEEQIQLVARNIKNIQSAVCTESVLQSSICRWILVFQQKEEIYGKVYINENGGACEACAV